LATGRTYYLCKEEMDAATAALKNYLARDSWTCYEIETSDDISSPTPGKFLLMSSEPMKKHPISDFIHTW
jgi:hypothetical protein